jgi:hypothetical protein
MNKSTPAEFLQQVERIAAYLRSLPEDSRRLDLDRLRDEDRTLHALVRDRLLTKD